MSFHRGRSLAVLHVHPGSEPVAENVVRFTAQDHLQASALNRGHQPQRNCLVKRSCRRGKKAVTPQYLRNRQAKPLEIFLLADPTSIETLFERDNCALHYGSYLRENNPPNLTLTEASGRASVPVQTSRLRDYRLTTV